MNILVAGGFDPGPEQEVRVREFCDALGAEVAEKGHVLLNGSITQLDSMIANAAYAKLVELGDENRDRRVISFVRLAKLERAAFAIVDLTELRPSVFYELGYADGMKKKVVVTAKEGTELPFDVKDVPTVFWDGQKQLEEDLKKRIRAVVKTGIGAAADPIG